MKRSKLLISDEVLEQVLNLSPASFDALEERMEQIKVHGRSVMKDALINDRGQLEYAAKYLEGPKRNTLWNESMVPYDWDIKVWLKMCRKNERQRKIMAICLRLAAIDREDFIKAAGRAKKTNKLDKTQLGYYELKKIRKREQSN